MVEGFYFENAEAACKFFDACREAKAKTYEEKMAVLRQMVKEKKAKYVPHPEEFLEGKNVLKVVPKEPPLE